MKRISSFLLAAATACLLPSVAFADAFSRTSPEPAIGVQVSTLGAGLQLSKQLGFGTDVRLQTGNAELNRSGVTNDFRYTGNAHLRNIAALIDFHPLHSIFRLTTGLVFAHDGADVVGSPQMGSYTFNGHSYPAIAVGQVNALVRFGNVSPYVGFGFGQPRHARVFLTGDFGVAFRSVQTSLTATGPATLLPSFAADLAKTQHDLHDNVAFLRTYPVVSLGLAARL